MVLLFARGEPVRRARPAPRPAADRHEPLPGHARGARVRRRQRRAVLELLHLLRHAGVRDRDRRRRPQPLRARHRRAAARRRLPPPRGAGGLGQAHRGRRPRAHRRGARAGRDGRLHLAHAAPGQRAALARADRRPARGARRAPRPGGHHRRPGLPGGARRRARRPVPPPRGARCGSRPRRWRSSSTARSSCPARRCRCSSCARRSSTASTTSSSAAFDFCISALLVLVLSPRAAGVRGRGPAVLARAGPLPLDPAGHRRRAVRVLQVPHDALGRRRAAGRPRVRERGDRPAVQDPRGPAHHARRARSCAATRSTSCRSCST